MYVILAYDVIANRTQLFKKISQRFLSRVQNSVFEGELTRSQFMNLTQTIRREIDVENEVVRIWLIADKQIFKIHTYGTPKQENENFL